MPIYFKLFLWSLEEDIECSSQDWPDKGYSQYIRFSQDGKKIVILCVCGVWRKALNAFSSSKKINLENELDKARSILRMLSQKTFRNCKIECSDVKLFALFIKSLKDCKLIVSLRYCCCKYLGRKSVLISLWH